MRGKQLSFGQLKVEKEINGHLICTMGGKARNTSRAAEDLEGEKGEAREDPAPTLNCFVLPGKAPDACSQATA